MSMHVFSHLPVVKCDSHLLTCSEHRVYRSEFEAATKKFGQLMKPAFTMQSVLREKTLGQSAWKRISKKQLKNFGRNFGAMMEKLTGRRSFIRKRQKQNREMEQLMAIRKAQEEGEGNSDNDRDGAAAKDQNDDAATKESLSGDESRANFEVDMPEH